MEFLHPSVFTRIIDNSEVYQSAQGATTLFAAFRSAIGPDNTIVELNNPTEAIKIFGTPNMRAYGQAQYNLINWLRAGGKAYAIRVLPNEEYRTRDAGGNLVGANAAYQTLAFHVEVKEDAGDFNVRTVFKPLTSGNTSVKGLEAYVSKSQAEVDTELTADGYKSFPMGIFFPYGRGKAYNLGIKLAIEDALDGTYTFRTYRMSIVSRDSTGDDLVVDGPFTVALDPLAKDINRESIYYADVINKYSTTLKVIDNKRFFETITDKLADTILDADLKAATDPSSFDIVFGFEKRNADDKIHDGILWNEDLGTAPAPSSAVYLANGSDGDWNDDLEEQLLNAAYSGLLTPNITNTKEYEIDVVLDANYPTSVKNAISQLAEVRKDMLSILDCKFQANVQQTLDYRKNSVGMSTYRTAIFAHDFQVYDEFMGGNIKVTSPYYLATKIPQVDIEFGLHWPFVGPRRGVLTGFEAINFTPNDLEKENLYKQQVNYVEKDPKRYNFATQLTSQKRNSALSDINNVRTILRIKREVEKMMAEYRMEFNDAITQETMSYNLNGYLQKWVANRACRTISGEVYASDYDRQQKIARVRISLVFTGIIERIFIDIEVNR